MAEDLDDETQAAWDRLLTPIAQLQLAASRAARAAAAGHELGGWASVDAEQVVKLLELASEMRDRLRYSQKRMSLLKSDLIQVRAQAAADLTASQQAAAAQVAAVQQAAADQSVAIQQQFGQIMQQMEAERANERAQADAKLAAFQSELTKLNQGVMGQAAALDAHADQTRTLHAELSAARQAQGAAQAEAQEAVKSVKDVQAAKQAEAKEAARKLKEVQAEMQAELNNAVKRVAKLQADRECLLRDLECTQASVEKANQRASQAEAKVTNLSGAMITNKSRLAELHQIEGLYKVARDEISRLEKENTELKDMVKDGVASLGKSRIFDLTSPAYGRQKSIPLHLTPEVQGKKRSAVTGRRAASPPPPDRHMGRISVARDVLFQYEDGLGMAEAVNGSPTQHWTPPGQPLEGPGQTSPTRTRPTSAGVRLSPEALPLLSWLGPPTSAYPADPELYEYLRVAGGYQPKYIGTKEMPKASGWVPKDIIRIVQAFKHAYHINTPDWRFWEPLLLMIDEVYSNMSRAAVRRVRAASAGRVRATRREVDASAYPATFQAARVAYLKRQLELLRRNMGKVERRDDSVMRRMAEKEYHLINQLDEAVDRNAILRRSLEEMDDLYRQEVEPYSQGKAAALGVGSIGVGYTP